MTRFLVATVAAAAIAGALALPVKAGLTECVDVRTTNDDYYVTVCLPWHE